jgi:hypothetical protein
METNDLSEAVSEDVNDVEANPVPDPVGDEAADEETLSTLKDEWGDEFDANLQFAHRTVEELDDELIAVIEESGLGNDPRVVRAAARIGRLLGQGQNDPDVATDPAEQEALRDEVDQLVDAPDYWSGKVQDRVRKINLRLHGTAPVPGHSLGKGGGR